MAKSMPKKIVGYSLDGAQHIFPITRTVGGKDKDGYPIISTNIRATSASIGANWPIPSNMFIVNKKEE